MAIGDRIGPVAIGEGRHLGREAEDGTNTAPSPIPVERNWRNREKSGSDSSLNRGAVR